ncbi:MAG TPA: hypothetical protein VFE60_11240 [Roseiarcus sp.]|nr:hypothetical protein [Roseiarcus sp.]
MCSRAACAASGEKVEVNAQLVSTETGAHVWADRFEGERSKLGELQLDVVSRLANSLGVELLKVEALRAARERPSNPDAVDLAMQAEVKEHSYSSDRKATINEAVALSERALALDPQNARALTVLANALLDREGDHYSDDPAGDIARAEKAIDAALALQPDSSSVHLAKSNLYFEKHQWGPSIAEAETAVAENPNNATAYASAGFNRLFLGRSEEGFKSVETAFRLSPRDPDVWLWQFYMCHLHAYLSHWEQAIPWCDKATAGDPQFFITYLLLTAANSWAGHDKEAKEAAAQLEKAYPGFTVQGWLGIHWSDDPTYNEQYARIVEGLRKAGVPEGEKKAN